LKEARGRQGEGDGVAILREANIMTTVNLELLY
jgi:hypothetical protein